MHLEVITPEKKLFEGEVVSATFPGSKGSFQVLRNHAPIISSLDKGKVSYSLPDGSIVNMTITGGVVEVLNNKISLLASGLIV